MSRLKLVLLACAWLCGLSLASIAPASAQARLPTGIHHQTIWVPDYYGSKVYRYVIDFTVSPPQFSSTTLDVSSQSCNPNSVAIKGVKLYVVCNGDGGAGGPDQILIYNYSTFAYIKTIDGSGPANAEGGTYQYFSGAGLIGIAFDIHGNLWVTGYDTNSLYRVPASQLSAGAPQIDRQVVDSPDSPAGLTFTASGALWVVGQYSGGILLQFPDSVINVAGTYLSDSPLNPNPNFCLSNVLTGCNPTNNLFNAPEGVAVFGGSVWVSNNGGNAPGRKLVRAIPNSSQTFTVSKFGAAPNTPFSCPGGLFAPTLAGATPELWVNDEGYGFANGGTCGATSDSQGSGVGRVQAFTSDDLLSHQSAPTPEVFPGAGKLKTGSPGFGGVFVQLD